MGADTRRLSTGRGTEGTLLATGSWSPLVLRLPYALMRSYPMILRIAPILCCYAKLLPYDPRALCLRFRGSLPLIRRSGQLRGADGRAPLERGQRVRPAGGRRGYLAELLLGRAGCLAAELLGEVLLGSTGYLAEVPGEGWRGQVPLLGRTEKPKCGRPVDEGRSPTENRSDR
eukprot:1667046-Rhodomonas_salina.1